ncbi:MAG: glycosyltransferase family 4 protein [Acetobacteraceae bacterium]|jgi:glycosyltransferase involved in cell wall biosynthesis
MKIIEITNVDFSLRQFLLPLMREMRARGHEVIGACAEGRFLETPRTEGFRIVAIPFERRPSPLAHWRAFLALVRLFRQEKPDLVHAHMPISGFLARMAAWWAGVPRIACTCHGFWFNYPGNPARRMIGFAMEWIAARVTTVFLTVSDEEACDARRLWISRDAVSVRNGRDPAVFHPDPAARSRIRDELGVPEDRVVVVAVSRLVRHKGYPELAAAMREVPGAELWVVGERLDSDRGGDMVVLLRDAGLGSRLRLLGYRTDVAAVLAAADIFVLPSHFEGLPMSVIEAMLTGLPVVATNIRGPREQVAPEATGLLVPPATIIPLANALRRLVDSPATREAMGAAGRARALERYDEAEVLARTLTLLGVGDVTLPL